MLDDTIILARLTKKQVVVAFEQLHTMTWHMAHHGSWLMAAKVDDCRFSQSFLLSGVLVAIWTVRSGED
jgi:hypothetical protein